VECRGATPVVATCCLMRRRAALATLIALCVTACANGNGSGSPGDKSEWSLLQSLELQYRGKIPTSSELTAFDGYDLMAVSSADGKARIWIMLWPKSTPFYKQMPAGNFEIRRDLWNQLQRRHIASSTVLSVLQSHLAKDS
jgi:hypothetical protein